MDCKVCEYYKNRKCSLERCIYKEEVVDYRKVKCYKCVWGKYTDSKYFCMIPRCQKE